MSAVTNTEAMGFRMLEGAGPPVEPLSLISSNIGVGKKRVSIHEVGSIYHLNADPRERFSIAALDRAKQMWVGYIDVKVNPVTHREFTCEKDIATLRRKHPWLSTTHVLHVQSTHLDKRYRGKGIGLGLYIAAAVAARKRGLALASDGCFMSSVSDEANRVWSSKGFARVVDAGPTGWTAVYVGERR